MPSPASKQELLAFVYHLWKIANTKGKTARGRLTLTDGYLEVRVEPGGDVPKVSFRTSDGVISDSFLRSVRS